jgi:hypothetical protein
LKEMSRLQKGREKAFHFMDSAPGKQSDGPPLGIQTESLASLVPGETGLNNIEKGMAYPLHIHACCLIKRDFEREEDHHFLHSF